MQDSSSPPSSAPSKNETLRGSPPAPSPDPELKPSPSPKSKSKRPPLSPPPPSNSPSSQEPISPIPEDGSASAPPPKNAIATPPTQEEEDSNSLSPPFLPPPPPPPAPPPPKSSTSPLPPFSSMPPLPPPSTPLLSGPPPPSPPPPPPNDDDGDDDDDVGVVDKSRNSSSNSTSPKKKKFYPPPSPPPPPPTTTMALPPIASPILTVPPPPPPPPPQTASNLPITQHPSPLSPPSPTQAITPAAPWPSSSQTTSSTTPPDATSSTRSTAPRPHVSTDTATPRPWVSTSSDTASPTMPSTSSDSRQAEDSEPLNHPPKEPGSFSPTPPTTEGGSSNAKHKDHNANLYIGLGVTGLAILLIVIAFVVLKRKRSKADAAGGHYRPPGVSTLRSVDGCYYDHGNAGGFSGSGDPYYAKKPSSAHPPGPGYSNGSCLGQGYAPGPPDPTGTRSWFTYEELMEITDGFSKENLIGEGGFGCVYKGWLLDGRRVAVKQLKAGSGQGDREFRAEVEIISRVHHRHLVSLVGYCIAEYHRLLVYEFVPNNTLEHHLHGKGLPVMDWTKRMRIAIGSARGLAYLHEDCHPRIIHRDIKSANILLDEYFEAQVADFGLAKLSDDANTHVSTRVMGTFGYMAPEYASSGKLTDRSDVFSFGVVLLEIITGRKPVDASQPLGDESLVEWARPHLVNALETGNIDELVDPRLESNFSRGEMIGMIEVAAACVRHSAPKRPRMVQVVRALDNDGELADLTNGVKFGQSTVYDSTQYSADIQKFRMMAYGSGLYSSEDGSSREYESRSTEFSGDSTESVQRPLNPQRPAQNITGQYMHQGRGFN